MVLKSENCFAYNPDLKVETIFLLGEWLVKMSKRCSDDAGSKRDVSDVKNFVEF